MGLKFTFNHFNILTALNNSNNQKSDLQQLTANN